MDLVLPDPPSDGRVLPAYQRELHSVLALFGERVNQALLELDTANAELSARIEQVAAQIPGPAPEQPDEGGKKLEEL